MPSADILHAFTLGILNARHVHDKMDGVMLMEHAKVHQALMEGSSKIFAAWLTDPSAA